MNAMQKISQQILAEQRKKELGFARDENISQETLRAMWHQRCIERNRTAAAKRTGSRIS